MFVIGSIATGSPFNLIDMIVVRPIVNILFVIFNLVHDFGLAIIIFTILVKLLMMPLTKRQLNQTKLIRKIQPELTQIKKNCKVLSNNFIKFVANNAGRRNGLIIQGKTHDDHTFTGFDKVSSTTIDDNLSGTGRPDKHICFETIAGGDRGNQHLLARPNTGSFNEILRYFYATFIFYIATGDHSAMNF